MAGAQSLAGSKASMVRQNRQANQHDYTFLRTASQVKEFVRRGRLVELPGNAHYQVATASFPYARPEVKLFIERLARQYHHACGEPLVVTSLTRPASRQPHNASPLSVHPTGMAADLRRSTRADCRKFLEDSLLTLESRGVLEATKERRPPHYHVSLFPAAYTRYLAGRGVSTTHAVNKRYRVSPGDSLWTIARRHGTTVAGLQKANGLRSSHVEPGQRLVIPAQAR